MLRVPKYLNLNTLLKLSDCDLDLNDINFQRTTYNPISAYSRSKTAEVLFSRALAGKLRVSTYVIRNSINCPRFRVSEYKNK